jgi:hypothetical protein
LKTRWLIEHGGEAEAVVIAPANTVPQDIESLCGCVE